MPEWLTGMYSDIGDEIGSALDPLLVEHWNNIYEKYIGLPLVF